MSGIAGLMRLDGAPVASGFAEAMTESMAHRGPDGVRLWASGSVALGHCMLQSTPESLEEVQPLGNEEESVLLVMDGWLSNWEELRTELISRRAHLRDRSDAELVLRAYEIWGPACVERMQGDFALIIWDARRRVAFCARDRMGHKPLHYHWDGRCLAFASELHAILALPWVDERLNEGLVAELLTRDLRTLDETLWEGVWRLPPAHRMTVCAKGCRLDRYWAPENEPELRYRQEEEYVEHYRALLDDEVRRHARAFAPLAFEVSGGLDSSAVFGVAETIRRRGRLPAPAIHAFTLRFEGGRAGADLGYARAVGAHFGVPVHEIEPTFKRLDWYRDWIRRDGDQPAPPHGTMQLGIREAALARGCRVVLGGAGGDQWLSGDHTYFAESLLTGDWGTFLGRFREETAVHGIRRSLFLTARHGVFPLLPYSVRRHLQGLVARARGYDHEGAGWLSERMARTLSDQRRRSSIAEPERQRPKNRQRLGFLLDPHHVMAHEAMDRLGAQLGLEQRSPLDSALIAEFAFAVPQQWLLRGGWNKYLHRRALKGVLPEVVRQRQSKAEFSIVFHRLQAGLNGALRERFPALENWVSREGFERVSNGPDASHARNMILLWRLLVCDVVGRSRDGSSEFGTEVRAPSEVD